MRDMNRARLERRIVSEHPLALSWSEVIWDEPYRNISAFDDKAAALLSKGWTGIFLENISNYELEVVQKLLVDADAMRLFCIPSKKASIPYYGLWVGVTRYLVLYEEHSKAVELHNCLNDIPHRVQAMVSNLPVDPYVILLLSGLNYMCSRSAEKDRAGHFVQKCAISVQEHAITDKVLAILALTQ